MTIVWAIAVPDHTEVWKRLRVLRILGIQMIPASVSEELPSDVRRPIGRRRNGGVFTLEHLHREADAERSLWIGQLSM